MIWHGQISWCNKRPVLKICVYDLLYFFFICKLSGVNLIFQWIWSLWFISFSLCTDIKSTNLANWTRMFSQSLCPVISDVFFVFFNCLKNINYMMLFLLGDAKFVSWCCWLLGKELLSLLLWLCCLLAPPLCCHCCETPAGLCRRELVTAVTSSRVCSPSRLLTRRPGS